MTRTVVVLAVALAALLAGCVKTQTAADPASAPASGKSLAQVLGAAVPPTSWSPKTGVDWWESFVNGNPKRDVYSPNNQAAREAIASELRGFGYTVRVMDFPAGAMGVTVPTTTGPVSVHVVEAVKVGKTNPSHAIALGGHYDTQTATIYGAYDNGAGTAAVVASCDALSKVELDRTLVCLLFDGEEVGTVGSEAYLGYLNAEKPFTLDWYLGFDMTGMNWPGYAWKFYAWVGDEYGESLFPFVNATLHDVLQYPIEGVEAFPFNDRNSDEATFKSAHVPTIRFAGGRTASTYDQYHMPQDTVQHVYDVVGGRANFEKGFATVVHSAYTLAWMLDATTLGEITADSSK